jgi:hypothetical protein
LLGAGLGVGDLVVVWLGLGVGLGVGLGEVLGLELGLELALVLCDWPARPAAPVTASEP